MKVFKLIDRTLLKFVVVGVINTLFGSAVMFAMYNLLGCSYWVSSAANYVFGSILSFFLNKHFTFQNQSKGIGVVIKFTVNIIVCYLLAYGIAAVSFDEGRVGVARGARRHIESLRTFERRT